jgi:hypothetical protein
MAPRNPPGDPMALGNVRMRFVRWFAAICAAAITTGCASSIDDDTLSLYSEPGKYDLLDCASISQRLATISYTEKQLAQLMTRASESAGGAMVNAMAYQDQYNTARARIRALRKAGEAKKCSPSDLNPPPTAPPE